MTFLLFGILIVPSFFATIDNFSIKSEPSSTHVVYLDADGQRGICSPQIDLTEQCG